MLSLWYLSRDFISPKLSKLTMRKFTFVKSDVLVPILSSLRFKMQQIFLFEGVGGGGYFINVKYTHVCYI